MRFLIFTTVTFLLTLTAAIPVLPRGEAAANAVDTTPVPGQTTTKAQRRGEAASNAVVVDTGTPCNPFGPVDCSKILPPRGSYRRHEAAANADLVTVPGTAAYQQERRSGYRRHEAAANAKTVGPCIKVTKTRDLEGRFIPTNCSKVKRGEAAANAITLPWDECETFVRTRALPLCNF